MNEARLNDRWKAGPPLVGLFARLRDATAYEILANTAIDFVIIDAEHGSFNRTLLAECVFACRAQRLSVLVRVPNDSEPAIQHALGVGADGIIVPHVNTAETIARVVTFARTRGIERAYAGATRVSSYRRETWPDFQKRETGRALIIAQIDEPPGIAAAQDIVSVGELDGIFLGQIGLALALEKDGAAAAAALEEVCRIAVKQSLPIGLSLRDESTAAAWRGRGVNLFAIDSDQGLLGSAADKRANLFRSSMESTSNPTRGN